MRQHWVVREPLALTRQRELADRSTSYAPRVAETPGAQELTLLGLIEAQYTRHLFYRSLN